MFTQDIWDVLAPTIVHTPVLESPYTTQLDWQILPIAYLCNFEPIVSQFQPFGLQFEDAIAIRPSNPSFLAGAGGIAIMPIGRCSGFKVYFENVVSETSLWLVGSQPVSVSCLNAQGHCVTKVQTVTASSHEPHRSYPERSIVVNTRATKVLRVDSKAPFIVTRFAIKRTCQPV